MKDPFLDQQWRDLNERLQRCAANIAGGNAPLAKIFAQQAAAFARQDPPQRYANLLGRVREAAKLAVQWQEQRQAEESRADSPGQGNYDDPGAVTAGRSLHAVP